MVCARQTIPNDQSSPLIMETVLTNSTHNHLIIHQWRLHVQSLQPLPLSSTRLLLTYLFSSQIFHHGIILFNKSCYLNLQISQKDGDQYAQPSFAITISTQKQASRKILSIMTPQTSERKPSTTGSVGFFSS